MTRYDLATPWQRFAEAAPWVIKNRDIIDLIVTISIFLIFDIILIILWKSNGTIKTKKGKQNLFFWFSFPIGFSFVLMLVWIKLTTFFWEWGLDWGKYSYEEALRVSYQRYWLVGYWDEMEKGTPIWLLMIIFITTLLFIDIGKKGK